MIKTLLFVLSLLMTPAHAQDANLRLAQAPNHPNHGVEHFYATWMMPEDRTRGCCNRMDCGEAEAKFQNGKWYARWTLKGKPPIADEDDIKEWIEIPDKTIEHDRDLPDGGAHLCARRLGDDKWTVFCFAAGAGG